MSSSEYDDELIMKDFDEIDSQLGEDHYMRLIQYLAVDSSDSKEGLLQLHQECRQVFSKYPVDETAKAKPMPKRASSQGRSLDRTTPTPLRPTPVVQKPRIMLTKRVPSFAGLNPLTGNKKIVT
ncbi:unnamed protein product [Auanema sp. JU1783]|nr:unnamed protein product [Auanema sp. JU1783]